MAVSVVAEHDENLRRPAPPIRGGRVVRLVLRRLLLTMLAAASLVVAVELFDTDAGRTGSVSGSDLISDTGGAIDPLGAVRLRPFTVDQRASVIRRLEAAAVRVTGPGCSGAGGGGGATGTGLLADGMLFTNAHIAGGARHVIIDRPDRPRGDGLLEPVTVTLAAIRPDVDLAFGPVGGGAELELAPGDPTVGQPVLLAGYGGGRVLSVLESTIHNNVDGSAYGSVGPVLLLDVPTGVGFSGGPVVDVDGRVVGLLRAYDSVTGLAVAVPVSTLRDAAPRVQMELQEVSC